jgi:branched-subunit amino acid ABC-type transport system permease component
MSSFLLFGFLGLGSGAVYALLGLGLVLVRRGSGVVNIALSAVAMYVAYVFVALHSTGTLQLPWPGLPHSLAIAGRGLGTALALSISLVYGGALGLLMYGLAFRPLRRAPELSSLCAAVGFLLYLQTTAVINFGTGTEAAAPVLPSGSLSIAGMTVPTDRIWLAAIAIVAATGLGAAFRYTRVGLLTRAVTENSQGATLLGYSVDVVAAANWAVGGCLAGVAGILILPITQLNPDTYTLFIVPALAVALVARFRSFGLCVFAGLVLGIAQSELTNLQTTWTWLGSVDLGDALPFLFVVAALVLVPLRAERTGVGRGRRPSIGVATNPGRATAASLAAGAALMFTLHGAERSALITSMVTACACLSVVVLTGYVGQISLAQMSLAGASAFLLSHLAQGAGIPFPIAPLLATAGAAPLSVLIGIPALRVRGMNLAIATLAAAAAADAVVFNGGWFAGGFAGRTVPGPHLLGMNLGISGSSLMAYPRAAFGILVLSVLATAGWLVARLRGGSAGQLLIAVRSNERAAASIGIDVAAAKLLAFALAGLLAGASGALLAYQDGTITGDSFTMFTSLNLLAIAYVAGVGRISGAIAAGILLAPGGLAAVLANHVVNVGSYQSIVASVALVGIAVAHPDGIASVDLGRRFVDLRLRLRSACSASVAAPESGRVVR